MQHFSYLLPGVSIEIFIFFIMSSQKLSVRKTKYFSWAKKTPYIDGFVQDCSISFANALEILQSCTKPSI